MKNIWMCEWKTTSSKTKYRVSKSQSTSSRQTRIRPRSDKGLSQAQEEAHTQHLGKKTIHHKSHHQRTPSYESRLT